MATVRARKGRRGTTYYAEVCVKGQRHGATFDTRSAAHAWAEQAEHNLRAGLALPGATLPADMPIPEALRKYESAACARVRPATQRMYAECVTRLERYFGGKTLRTLTSQVSPHTVTIASSTSDQQVCCMICLFCGDFIKLRVSSGG